jgi:hypothetical protein
VSTRRRPRELPGWEFRPGRSGRELAGDLAGLGTAAAVVIAVMAISAAGNFMTAGWTAAGILAAGALAWTRYRNKAGRRP